MGKQYMLREKNEAYCLYTLEEDEAAEEEKRNLAYHEHTLALEWWEGGKKKLKT